MSNSVANPMRAPSGKQRNWKQYKRVRLLSPLGYYPSSSISVGNSHLLIANDIAVSVVLAQPEEVHGVTAEQYSEVGFLCLDEIKFFSALILAHSPNHGMVYPYPLPAYRDYRYLKIDRDVILDNARTHALSLDLAAYPLRGSTLPPLLGGPIYDSQQHPLDTSCVGLVLDSIQPHDHLMMRGLGALVEGSMLWTRVEFQVAATMALYVALEASFQLILERLRRNGIENPGAREAGTFLNQIFNPGLDSERYFQEFYEDRIKVLHPVSRFGSFPFAPLQADDYYFLRHDLVDVFFYLLTGVVRRAE